MEKNKPLWQGYMTAVTKGSQTCKASIDFLPMVNLDPNSWECIYSVLMWGKEECEKMALILCSHLISQYGGLQNK